ncbi:MAG TPA: hypothetical protein VMP12_00760 [Candidatus Sulfotelmatobacter sp.]|nr:hypothetical protein [Candidatus Sulfotelmatobacter sp.]
MADDTNLQVGVVIDTTGLTAGTSEVQAAVEQMASVINEKFGSIANAPEGVRVGLERAKEASTTTGAAFVLAAQKINESWNDIAVSGQKAGSGIERAMALATGRIAASEAGVGMLGNSLARVGAASEALEPLLAAAFPIAAGIALVSIVGEAVDKFEKLQEGIRKAIIEGENLGESSRRTAEGLELENVKLEIQIDKLEGRPTNNKLAAALLEAQLKADQLGTSLQNDVDKAASLLDTGAFGSLLTSFSVNEKEIQGQLRPFLDAIQQAKLEVAQAPAGTPEFTAAINREKDAYKTLGENVKEWIKITDPGAIDSIAKLENLYRVTAQSLNALGDAQKNNKLQTSVGNLEDAKTASDRIKQLMREQEEEGNRLVREDVASQVAQRREHEKTVELETRVDREAVNKFLETLQKLGTEQERANAKRLADFSKEKDEELRIALDTAKRRAEAEMSDAGGKGSNGGAQLQQKMAILDAEYNAEREAILKRISELDPEQIQEAQKLSDRLVKIWEQMEDKKAALDEKAREQIQRNF